MTYERYHRCPRCKVVKDMLHPALSRRDNKTRICSECGTHEAMEDAGWLQPWQHEPYWQEKVT